MPDTRSKEEQEFTAGQRVRLSQRGLESLKGGGLLSRCHTNEGTVVCERHGFVRVKPDGYKTSDVYEPSFWQPIPTKTL